MPLFIEGVLHSSLGLTDGSAHIHRTHNYTHTATCPLPHSMTADSQQASTRIKKKVGKKENGFKQSCGCFVDSQETTSHTEKTRRKAHKLWSCIIVVTIATVDKRIYLHHW